ncbi:hypothetical protein DRN62_02930, partial [Nanoarchaeota archaeon]
MRAVEHLKLATFTGFLVGLFLGTVDFLARIIVWSFEWFELYLSLFTSILIVMPLFTTLGLLMELVRRAVKFKFDRKRARLFYFSSSIAFLLCFYGLSIVNSFILHFKTFRDPLALKLSSLVFVFSGAVFLSLLLKGDELASKAFSLLSYLKRKKILENYVFFVFAFIIISFFMDIFLLNYIPTLKSSEEVRNYPNVILITLDTLRADHLSLYGYPLNTTPNLDRIAEDAVVFEDAIATSSWTLPSHASIFTGRYPYHHGATARHQLLRHEEKLLAEILREKGYVTAGFVGGPFCKAKYGIAQGFMFYDDRLDFFEYWHTFDKLYIGRIFHVAFPDIDKFIFRSDGERSSEEINRRVFKWLEKNKDQTFFMFINYFDTHMPYNLGKEFKERFTNDTRSYKDVVKIFALKRNEEVSEEDVDFIASLYDTEIFHLDHHLEELFDELDELGIKNDTIIIITSDHGEEFHDHGGFGHGWTLYQEVVHVPLIIYYPKEFSPKRIEERVSLTDLFPTILDVLGMDTPENIDGVSLLPLIKGDG